MTPDQIIAATTEELKSKYGCHTVILYGSRARGDATEGSDYDILGVRATGSVFRDARLWHGVYLDIFVYSDQELSQPHGGLLDMRLGKVLFEEGDFASRFFAKLEKIYEAGPKKLRADEIQALRTWHAKALDRIRAGGIQGDHRRAELVPAILEHYFTTRGEWFRGPKAALGWLRESRPILFRAFENAFKATASIGELEKLVKLVDAEIEKEAKPAAPEEKAIACATLGHIQLNTPRLEEQVAFYEKYFGFKRKAHGKGWFLWNRAGFLMAVNPLAEPPAMPEWFHIGFRYETQEEVSALHDRLKADGMAVGQLDRFDDYMQFRFQDPTGYTVEIFWEPPPDLWS